MAGSVNKVIIIGNLGSDPDIRTFPGGGKVANLSVATSERWKDKNSGEQRERTEWHKVAVHVEGAVNYVEQYLAKGSKVYVEGKLETRKWQDQSGQDRYTTEIVVRPYSGQITGLDGRQGGERSGGGAGGGRSSGGSSRGGYDDDYQRPHGDEGRGAAGGARDAARSQEFDDDIPF